MLSAPSTSTTARIDVDHPAVARWTVRGLALLAVTAFVVGAPALIAVGTWAGLGWAAWGLPLVVDLGLVIGAVSATVARQRQAPAGLLWAGTAVLVGLSTLSQGVHAWTSTSVAEGPARWTAIALGSLPPLAVLWTTESLIRLIVSEPVRRNRRAPQRAVAPTPAQRPTEAITELAPIEVAVEAPDEPQPTLEAQTAPATAARPDRAATVVQARQLLAQGLSVRQAADEVGVSRSTLSRWLAEPELAELAVA